MICPYCGKPMEKGFMATTYKRGIFWLPEAANIRFFDLLAEYEVAEEHHGIVLAVGGQPLKKQHPWKKLLTAAPMYVCRTCKKAIASFDDTLET